MKTDDQVDKSSRRDFLRRTGTFGALIIAVGAFFGNLLAFFSPGVKKDETHKYLVAKVSEIPLGQAKEVSIQDKPVFVVHLENGFKVFSGVCTHLGCIVKWEPNNDRFYCPCHKGVFNREGEVVEGPPPRSLDEFKVEIDKELVFIHVSDKKKGPWA